MAPKRAKKKGTVEQKKKPEPAVKAREPTLISGATTSKQPGVVVLHSISDQKPSCGRRCLKYLYNREEKTFCERTCQSWFYIISYSIIYLIFLMTYMLVFLFASLTIIKYNTDFKKTDSIGLLTYSKSGVGLTTTPTSVNAYPLIWYKESDENDYQKYINAIDKMFQARTSNVSASLGPCGHAPYGYGNDPCVIIRINKRHTWAGKPLHLNSSVASHAPEQVKNWIRSGKLMLWLHCDGHHAYDKEHISNISYYPYPPGFDASSFPMDVRNDSPLVSVQFSKFTRGVSLAIQCKLWYDEGPSSTEFVLYVEPKSRTRLNSQDMGG